MTEDITPEELRSRLTRGEQINFFDVSEEWEHEEFNIGARLLPLPAIPMKLDLIRPLRDEEVILHCKSGRRSNQAKKFLKKQGFKNVRCLIGGVEAYTEIG